MIAELVMAFQVATEAPLDNPRQEERAQALMREIRCVVCENEPVSQSTADIAVDMRREIRAQISDGKSDGEVRRFFTDRYGQYVSFRPPMEGPVLLLWAFPFALLLGVAGFLGFRSFRRRRPDLKPLSDASLDERSG